MLKSACTFVILLFMKANTTQVRIDNHIYEAVQAYAKELGLSTTSTVMLLLEVSLIHARKHPGRPEDEKERLAERARRRARYLKRLKEGMVAPGVNIVKDIRFKDPG